jgi:FAD/FMN-containing dehydrogenase
MMVRGQTADTSLVSEDDIQDLKSRLRGELLRPGADGYDIARQVRNGIFDRSPALIARCAGVADVIAAVNFGRAHSLLTAVRAGGHSAAGYGTCDGGLLIDLSGMRGIRVDPVRQTARVQGGALWHDLDHETAAFGLAVTGGQISSTGVAGLTLGGGLGWLMRHFGLTVDNLLSVDLVTADGRLLTASSTDHPDLFWGLRGGGGNFGIATELEFRLHPVSTVWAGMVIHPNDRAADVLRFYQDYSSAAPDELTVMVLLLWPAPAVPSLAAELHGKPAIALAVCYSGSLAEGERVLQPLRAFGSPLSDLIRPMPYAAFQTMFDEGSRLGFKQHARSDFLQDLTADAIETIVAQAAKAPSRLSRMLFTNMRGAVSRAGPDETAFSHRDAPHVVEIISKWVGDADPAPAVEWVEESWTALQPFATGGAYVNFLGDEGEARVRAAYSPRTYERLVALKNQYDPTNFFRINQNVRPTTLPGASGL